MKNCFKFKDVEEYKEHYGINRTTQNSEPFKPTTIGKAILPHRFVFTMERCKEFGVKSVLDVGCHDSAFSFLLQKNGIRSDGVDVEPRGIDFCRKFARKVGTDSEFFCGIIEELDIDKQYDAVSSFEVIEHVLDVERFLKKLESFGNRYVFLSTPHKDGVYGENNNDPNHLRVFDEKMMVDYVGANRIVYNLFTNDLLLTCYEVNP